MDYVPKVGDWILYSKEDGLKMGVVRYIRKPKKHLLVDGPVCEVDLYYTDSDRVVASEILEIRT